MAKITRLGGMTDATVRVLLPGRAVEILTHAGVELDEWQERVIEGLLAEHPDDAEPGEVIGGFLPPQGDEVDLEEDAWPGSSSETSPVKPPKNAEPTKPSRRKRARAVGSPSTPTKGSTTASSTGTSTPETDA
jgi:hypothetical protein